MTDIKIISMGPGDEKYLTAEAKDAINGSDILIGAEKFRDLYGSKLIVPETLISGTIEHIKANNGKKIGVLVTGDAGFYSLGKSVIKEFGKDNVTVIAGISVVQLAFAKICEPWQDAQFISIHGRSDDIEINSEKFIVLCDNKTTSKEFLSKVISQLTNYDLYAMEDLGMPNENIVEINDKNDINRINGSSLGIVIGIRR